MLERLATASLRGLRRPFIARWSNFVWKERRARWLDKGLEDVERRSQLGAGAEGQKQWIRTKSLTKEETSAGGAGIGFGNGKEQWRSYECIGGWKVEKGGGWNVKGWTFGSTRKTLGRRRSWRIEMQKVALRTLEFGRRFWKKSRRTSKSYSFFERTLQKKIKKKKKKSLVFLKIHIYMCTCE